MPSLSYLYFIYLTYICGRTQTKKTELNYLYPFMSYSVEKFGGRTDGHWLNRFIFASWSIIYTSIHAHISLTSHPYIQRWYTLFSNGNGYNYEFDFDMPVKNADWIKPKWSKYVLGRDVLRVGSQSCCQLMTGYRLTYS